MPRWLLYRACAYLGGQGISFGDPIVPHAAKAHNKGSINVDVVLTPEVDIIDNQLDRLMDGKFDHLFIGPRLEMMDNPPSMLKTLTAKLAPHQHLVFAQKLDNRQAKFHWDSNGMKQMVEQAGKWKLKALYERDGWALHIYKKLYGKKGIELAEPLSGKPRACICRYGALGDMIMITPLIHQLYDDGYDVTMNISPYAMPIIEHNPYIKNLIIQEREMIPNPELGPYWDEWKSDYARYINLSESLEGRFLKVEGRRDFYTPKEWRIKTGEHNYYDATMRFGGYPEAIGRRGELYFTNAEERNCERALKAYKDKFLVIWAMNGSSHHKIYPAQELVIEDFLLAHPDAYVVTVGDGVTRLKYQHQRLHDKTGEWSIRESLCAAKYASLVIGPETMMTNGSGSLGTPTITLLSHSTHEALCKHWGENDYCLSPSESTSCWPCFQLHYSRESCPIKQLTNSSTGDIIAEGPACTFGIEPERLLARMEEVYEKYHYKHGNDDSVISKGIKEQGNSGDFGYSQNIPPAAIA